MRIFIANNCHGSSDKGIDSSPLTKTSTVNEKEAMNIRYSTMEKQLIQLGGINFSKQSPRKMNYDNSYVGFMENFIILRPLDRRTSII